MVSFFIGLDLKPESFNQIIHLPFGSKVATQPNAMPQNWRGITQFVMRYPRLISARIEGFQQNQSANRFPLELLPVDGQ
jgi:hypothetical protein